MSSTIAFPSSNQSFESGRTDKYLHDEESEISKWLKLESDLPLPSNSTITPSNPTNSTTLPTFNTFSSQVSAPQLSAYSSSAIADHANSFSSPFPFVAPPSFSGAQFPTAPFPNPYATYGFLPNGFLPSSFPNVNLGALALLPGLFGSQPGLTQMSPAQFYQVLAQVQQLFKNQGFLVGDLSNMTNNPNVLDPSSMIQQSSSPSSPVLNSTGSSGSPSVSHESSSVNDKKRKPSTVAPGSPQLTAPRVNNTSPSSGTVVASNNSSNNSNNANNAARRIRQTRPKVVESKGGVQCKGRNRKKGIQCRNAALMEYIGPRPIYCAEHIELDPLSLYEKCKSNYQKEPGDNKGCKEVVLKEFGYCYKHYPDFVQEIVLTHDSEKAYKHQLRIHELLIQLEKEAAAAKKKDGDLYQRKNKLIPKFQEMKKAISKVIAEHFQNARVTLDNPQHQHAVASPPQPLSPPSSSASTPAPSVSSSPVVSRAPSVIPFEEYDSSPSSSASFTSSNEEDHPHHHHHHFHHHVIHAEVSCEELPEEISPSLPDDLEHHAFADDDLSSELSGSEFSCNEFHHHHHHHHENGVHSVLSDSGSSTSDGETHLVMCSSTEVDLVNDVVDFVDAVNGHSLVNPLMGQF